MIKHNKLFKCVVSIILVVALIFVFPFSASCATHTEGSDYEGGAMVDIDTANDDYWAVTNGKWHRFEYVDNFDFSKQIADMQQAMYNHQDIYSAYIIMDESLINYDDYNGTTIEEKRANFVLQSIFAGITDSVYEDNGKAWGGDYLQSTTDYSIHSESGWINASTSTADYELFRITISLEYNLTENQEKQVRDYAEEWSRYYIQENEVISNATGDEREYLIVKTIYNFISKNTAYDNQVYNDKDHSQFPENSVRYIVSHNAYGALFGNIEKAYEDDFQYKTVDEITGETSYISNLQYTIDSQGLARIVEMNQGRAVCDGYSQLFYYLCKLNGIDCKIVQGDYVTDNGKESDPHAWNMVYLKDYDDQSYEWYYVDSTFASQRTQKLSQAFTVVDYEFFLRGSENGEFSSTNHQQMFDEYIVKNQSPDDYKFKLKIDSDSSVYALVSRRRTDNPDEKYVADGVYNLENYLLIDKDGNAYSFDESNDYNIFISDGFHYYSTGYYYTCELNDYALGIEYTCDMQRLVDIGEHSFDIYTITGEKIYQKVINILPLDMSDLEKNYNLSATTINDSELSNVEIVNGVISTITEFRGSSIIIDAKIVDSSGAQLTNGTDYSLYCYDVNDSSKTHINPKNPGEYKIRIDYFGNYCGYIEMPLEITKADFSRYKQNVNCRYGADIENGITGIMLGNIETDDNVTIKKNVDFKIISVTGGRNYGDKGEILVEALPGSAYLKAGTQSIWNYNISEQYDISALYNGNPIGNAHYKYTGSQVKPTEFKLSYISQGNKVDLVKDKDYKIVGYKDNVNVGTATVIVEFIGNYKGTANMTFCIDPTNWNVSIPDLTYNGKAQRPSPSISSGGNKLVNGTDFVVTSTAATAPGIYSCTIKGCGIYSAISGNYIYYIKPSAISNIKTSTTTNSVSLSWSGQGSNCVYQIYQYDSYKKTWRLVCQTTSKSAKITAVYRNGVKSAVKANTAYQFKIRGAIIGQVNGKSISKYGAFTTKSVRTHPSAPQISSLTKGKTTLKVSWKKNTAITGYNVVLATNSKFTTGVKKVTIGKNTAVSYTFKSLKKSKTYYVKIRSYKKVGSTHYYSPYSKTVKVKL